MRAHFLTFLLAAPFTAAAASQDAAPVTPALQWETLETESYAGKQDDIVFVTPARGWYVNGTGRIYTTRDGGDTWTKQHEHVGTFFRAIAFVDEQIGVVGNVGVDYFPGVTDDTLLYRTTDGGDSWAAVEGLPTTGGICAIQVLREPFINHGDLAERTRLVAGGRVGGPSALFTSDDLGVTWTPVAVPKRCGMILDVHFFDRSVGLIAASTSAAIDKSQALVLRTDDGGETWSEVYVSGRPFETTWKFAFPSDRTGFVTVQSYDPTSGVSKRYVAKTEDAGLTWREQLLVDDASVRAFGIGFLDEQRGWVGAVPHAFATTDGGLTWSRADLGRAVNKIRFIDGPDGKIGYAVGVGVHRLAPTATAAPDR